MRILADSSLPGLDLAFPDPFILSRYSDINELSGLIDKQDILLCRSTLKVNKDLLKNHILRYVATASSGTNHLDHSLLESQNIQIIDAKGSNASSVADYVLSCLVYLDQHRLILGKKVAIIGLGEVGSRVSERLEAAKFQIFQYDPLKAQKEKSFQSCELEDLYEADIICIHAELHNHKPYPSFNMIDEHFLSQLKKGCVIINAARGGIVNEEAVVHNPRLLRYCTDVYLNEPSVNKQIIDKSILCTPHIAGHSVEAKYAAVIMVSEKLHQLLGLPIPTYALPKKIKNYSSQEDKSWQEQVLSVYNPAEESLVLKRAQDKEQAFLTLRKSHQKRHDFSLYSNFIADQKNRPLFGIT